VAATLRRATKGRSMDLTQLPVEDGFRMRGQQVTRLETFVDAAFAFSLTLLVIFYNALPDTVAELAHALRRADHLALDANERFIAQSEAGAHAGMRVAPKGAPT
jgi:hypothetical protein